MSSSTTLLICVIQVVLVLIALSRTGIDFSMITLALSQMLFFFLQASFTGGEDGLQSVPRGNFLGLDLTQDLNLFYVVLAFVLSAALAGLAGATKTLVLGFATLTNAVWTTSGLVILMTLVGGMGTLVGPMLGTLIIIALENKIGDLSKALAEITGVT